MYSIGELAKELGIPASTIRYYDKLKLLPPVNRTEGGARRFSEEDREMLFKVCCLKKMGFKLEEIKEYMKLQYEGDGTIDARAKTLEEQKALLQEQIQLLNRMMSAIDYKLWLFERAKESSYAQVRAEMMNGKVPQEHKSARAWWLGIEYETNKGE